MPPRAPFLFIILALLIVGIVTTYHRHTKLGVPLTPGQRITIWQVEAQINFDANNEAVSAELALPNDQRFELVLSLIHI